MAEYPKINGHKHDHSSIELSVTTADGTPRKFVAIAEITYRQGLTPGQVRGTAAQLLALTKGTLSAGEGSLALPKEDAQELREALGQGYMEQTSTITINYSALFAPTITDTLKGVRLTEEETTSSGGSEDPINDTFSLMYVEGTRGGLSPVTPLNQTPTA